MNIHFEWPKGKSSVVLAASLTAANAAVFDVISGEFGVHNGHLRQDNVLFYWHITRPVMMNLSTHCVCRLNDVEVAFGSVHPLPESSHIQVGHFRLFLSSQSHSHSKIGEPFSYRSVCDENNELGINTSLEIEQILPNGGTSINDLRYINDVVLAEANSGDILKTLEVEYKRFLIWREQGSGTISAPVSEDKRILKKDARFEIIREEIKGKTLTECIVGSNALIEKVLSQLGPDEQWSELFAEEEKPDLLHALSPELNITKGTINVPELVFQDISKVGLDTYY
ncbi:TagK domain-containing protein [Pantoea allii]|nr:TagK domain-containing protein [Pantoea allii]THB83442.1 TagK domain-containing protein [Pantoea allii]